MLCSLPCTESELTQWLAASQGRLNRSKFNRLVRTSPTLFLLAASRAAACTGAPIESMTQLLSRLEHCFSEERPVETSLGHVIDVCKADLQSIEWAPKTLSLIPDFLQARKRKGLTKTLSKLVRKLNKQFLSAENRASKPAVKSLVESMFVDSFRVDRQKVSSALRESDQWPSDANGFGSEAGQAALLGLIKDRQSYQRGHENRLLDAKLAAMKQLAYGASHEINNPLANIATRAQTILADESDPDRRFQLAVIHEQAMRAHDMISDMMLFAHPPELQPESVDVRTMVTSLVRESESNLLPLIRCGAQVSVTVGPRVGLANIDPTQCKVALSCLIQNAAEAIRKDDGEIDIRVHSRDGKLCFEVSDNGVGIDEQVQQHLFDPFYSGREAGRGLGFGLSKSWRIAQLHGGSLSHRVDADELRTVFELRLPE